MDAEQGRSDHRQRTLRFAASGDYIVAPSGRYSSFHRSFVPPADHAQTPSAPFSHSYSYLSLAERGRALYSKYRVAV